MSVRQGGRYRVDPATGERRRIEDEPAAAKAPVPTKPEAPAKAAAGVNTPRTPARESNKSEE